MSFFDEIKKAQREGFDSRNKQEAEAHDQKNKAIQDTVKMITFRVKETLLNKAKQVSPTNRFTFDGFVYCFAYSTEDNNLLSPYEIFNAENFISAFGPIVFTLSPVGEKVLALVKTTLAADGIMVVSFCCQEGDSLGCLELPVTIKYRTKSTRAIWDLKGSNKKVKIERDSFDTSISDCISLGAHVIFNS